jgi:hypothetical protein
MAIGGSIRKSIPHKIHVTAKYARPNRQRRVVIGGQSKDSLAQKLREVDDAVRRNDPEALFDLADQALARIGRLLKEIVTGQNRVLKEMAKVQKRIDRNQAETARILDQLVNGAARR